ncbi:alpha/beta hydrolase [Microbispora rosea]|uniref:alpha/beta fold hydrolase n=1 Tax=Microbispora rosea TaxID=58117 RepID=UPI0034144DFF
MPFSQARRGFRIFYERSGHGTPVVLIHGNPGDHTEFSRVVPLLGDTANVVTPDLRGYGKSDKHLKDVCNAYSLSGQVDGVIALIDELGISNAVLCGYDVGSFTVQTLAMKRPDLAHSLVIAPPTMGVGRRILEEKAVNAFLHAIMYKTSLVEDLIDGKPEAVRAVLRENLVSWSPPRLPRGRRSPRPSHREPLGTRRISGQRDVVPPPRGQPHHLLRQRDQTGAG